MFYRDANNATGPVVRLGAATELAIGAAAVSSGSLGVAMVRLVSTVPCRIAIGAGVTAVSTSTYLPANVPEYFQVSGLDRISVIRELGDGKLSITEVG